MRTEVGGDRLFRLAMFKFEEAIRSTPDNQDTLNTYGDVLVKVADSSVSELDQEQYLTVAFEKYSLADNLNAILKLGLLIMQSILKAEERWVKNRDKFFLLAEKCFREAENRWKGDDSGLYNSLRHHAELLLQKAKYYRDADLAMAGTNFKLHLVIFIRCAVFQSYKFEKACFWSFSKMRF
jgi:hypothetical protein